MQKNAPHMPHILPNSTYFPAYIASDS